MKVAAGFAAVAAFASTASAGVAWSATTTDTATKETKTTTTEAKPTTYDPSSTWADWESTTTTSTTEAKPTTYDPSSTWADWELTTADPDSWTTTVVTAITTYCPEATKITHGGKTWTVTSATTLTITDCPCTVSVPVYTATTTSCSETDSAKADPAKTWGDWESSTYVAPTPYDSVPSSSSVVYAYDPSTTSPSVATYTGAANGLVANVGAGLAGVAGIAAFLL